MLRHNAPYTSLPHKQPRHATPRHAAVDPRGVANLVCAFWRLFGLTTGVSLRVHWPFTPCLPNTSLFAYRYVEGVTCAQLAHNFLGGGVRSSHRLLGV